MKTTTPKDKLTPPPIGSRWIHNTTGIRYTVDQCVGWSVMLTDYDGGRVLYVDVAAVNGGEYTRVD